MFVVQYFKSGTIPGYVSFSSVRHYCKARASLKAASLRAKTSHAMASQRACCGKEKNPRTNSNALRKEVLIKCGVQSSML